MDNNRDRRTEGNDVLRDALEANKNEREFFDYENETIIFRKAYKQNTASKDDKSEMQHTAQIRGGAVVRPLKQTTPPAKPQPAKPQPANTQPAKSQPAKAEKDLPVIFPKAMSKTSPRPASANANQQPPKADTNAASTPRTAATGVSSPQNRRIVPAEGRNMQLNKPSGAALAAPKTAAPASVSPKPPPKQTEVAKKPTSTPASVPASKPVSAPVSSPKTVPAAKPATVPVAAAPQSNTVSKNNTANNTANGRYAGNTSGGRVIQPKKTDTAKAGSTSNQRLVRSENDDFEIDEATYTGSFWKQRKNNNYNNSGDSASGAVMSLVKAMIYIVVIIAVSVGLSVFVINTANDIFKFVVDERIVSVTIPENATIDDITEILYDAGAIKNKWAFKLWSSMKDAKAEFIPGDYEISTSLNYDYLRAAFKPSTQKTEVRITIPEGYTVDEIIDLFTGMGIGTREGFVDVINNYEFDYPFLENLITRDGRIYRLEGYLFPDTYYFYADSSEVTVIKKLLDNFNRKFISEYYARCAELGLSVDDAIILASMVEKETRYADELGYVSSVFHNRIKYSATFPYLNSDATIMYAMAHDLGGRPDNMAGEDTAYDSPYNTYTYKGLPPGPIANPGLNAIKYALYPNDTNYFYFVSDSSGRTLFATTEPEHLENIATIRARG